ncbi:MAG: winged helix-turn-helix transcriptional regulator [Candidatus Diapherotrites archaeon]
MAGQIQRRGAFKIVIRQVERPFSSSRDDELNWICQTFGFFEPRLQGIEEHKPVDSGGKVRGKTAAAVFRVIVDGTEKGKPPTSTALSQRVGMSRGSIINHLNNLMRSGLIVRHGRVYESRSRSIFRTVSEIEEDIERIFQKMKKAAKDIDEEFGIKTEE